MSIMWMLRNELSYGWMQAKGQARVLLEARAIEKVLLDPMVEDELKEKIRMVDEIKSFADTALHMESDDLYRTLFDQKGKDILWNLSGCMPFSLDQKIWSFPLVGEVSYKGFFDYERAKEEEGKLKQLGYDTRVRTVNAWSTLGWFEDPILSNTLRRDPGSLAELFIHEITHAHIFYKDSINFNENLASFVGEQGALFYLSSVYGVDSKEVLNYRSKQRDDRLFTDHCLAGLQELKQLYSSFDADSEPEDKLSKKRAFMRSWVVDLQEVSFSDSARYEGYFRDDLPNNAFFMAFNRYDSKKAFFEHQFKTEFSSDLKKFIDFHRDN